MCVREAEPVARFVVGMGIVRLRGVPRQGIELCHCLQQVGVLTKWKYSDSDRDRHKSQSISHRPMQVLVTSPDKSEVGAINRPLHWVDDPLSEMDWAWCLFRWGSHSCFRTRTSTRPPICRRHIPLSLRLPTHLSVCKKWTAPGHSYWHTAVTTSLYTMDMINQ